MLLIIGSRAMAGSIDRFRRPLVTAALVGSGGDCSFAVLGGPSICAVVFSRGSVGDYCFGFLGERGEGTRIRLPACPARGTDCKIGARNHLSSCMRAFIQLHSCLRVRQCPPSGTVNHLHTKTFDRDRFATKIVWRAAYAQKPICLRLHDSRK